MKLYIQYLLKNLRIFLIKVFYELKIYILFSGFFLIFFPVFLLDYYFHYSNDYYFFL